MREITVGSIAIIKVNNWATCATTRNYGAASLRDATHVLVTDVFPTQIRGRAISIQGDEYRLSEDEFRWHLSRGDVRPTGLAERLTLKED